MTVTLVELTAEIVSAHASGTEMSTDQIVQEIHKVYAALKKLDAGDEPAPKAVVPTTPTLTVKKAFQDDQLGCLVCGKTGFKTLTRHLKQAHNLKPGQYRKQFNIATSQSLTAKNYSEARRKAANENNLAANLEKARAARVNKKSAGSVAKSAIKAAKTTKPEKAEKLLKTAKAPKQANVLKPRKSAISEKAAKAPKVAKAAKVQKTAKPVKSVKTRKTTAAAKAPKVVKIRKPRAKKA